MFWQACQYLGHEGRRRSRWNSKTHQIVLGILRHLEGWTHSTSVRICIVCFLRASCFILKVLSFSSVSFTQPLQSSFPVLFNCLCCTPVSCFSACTLRYIILVSLFLSHLALLLVCLLWAMGLFFVCGCLAACCLVARFCQPFLCTTSSFLSD